jgi:hypothetical protein
MRIITKYAFERLMEEYPDGGIVFAEYEPNVRTSDLMVTNGDFGATNVVPMDGEVFDWDWNIGEYRDDDLFVVLDNDDVLQMVKTLVSGLKIDLRWE